MDARKIPLNPWAITWPLSVATVLLVAANMSMQAYRLIAHQEHVVGLAMMSMDGENNLPALFSTLLLFCASLLLALIAVLERRHEGIDVSKWAILAAGFMLMAMDESLSFHEKAIAPLRALLGGQHLGIFFFAWVIPGFALVFFLGAFFLRFLLRLPRRTAIAFVVSAAIYLGGALGVELIEGWWREAHGHKNLIYHVLVSLEEGMEMAGVIAFIHALLRYVAGRFGEVRFAFAGTRDKLSASEPAK
ncbi:hypothetical protein [Lysobacter sp. Root667]|uniref:hypothetical protein n=1 Tax=Lysobacter sp. Root667 TaxID=1736581 RepID=UPI000A87C9AB|nr:hypothetical protein [Lysobacter sp. Root667]